jgi:hypothetical protein
MYNKAGAFKLSNLYSDLKKTVILMLHDASVVDKTTKYMFQVPTWSLAYIVIGEEV